MERTARHLVQRGGAQGKEQTCLIKSQGHLVKTGVKKLSLESDARAACEPGGGWGTSLVAAGWVPGTEEAVPLRGIFMSYCAATGVRRDYK